MATIAYGGESTTRQATIVIRVSIAFSTKVLMSFFPVGVWFLAFVVILVANKINMTYSTSNH